MGRGKERIEKRKIEAEGENGHLVPSPLL